MPCSRAVEHTSKKKSGKLSCVSWTVPSNSHCVLTVAAQSKNEMQRGLLLNVVVGECGLILELLAAEDESLLGRRDTLLLLYHLLDLRDRAEERRVECGRPAEEPLDMDRHHLVVTRSWQRRGEESKRRERRTARHRYARMCTVLTGEREVQCVVRSDADVFERSSIIVPREESRSQRSRCRSAGKEGRFDAIFTFTSPMVVCVVQSMAVKSPAPLALRRRRQQVHSCRRRMLDFVCTLFLFHCVVAVRSGCSSCEWRGNSRVQLKSPTPPQAPSHWSVHVHLEQDITSGDEMNNGLTT